MKGNKGLALFIGIIAITAVLASSASWWLPKLLTFIGTNGNLIQSLTDSIQIVLWLGVLLVSVGKLWLSFCKVKSSEEGNALKSSSNTGESYSLNSPSDASNLSGSIHQLGKNNLVAKDVRNDHGDFQIGDRISNAPDDES